MLSPKNVAENLTPEQLGDFLQALSDGFSASGAAKKAQRPRQYFYCYRPIDPEFDAAWTEAEQAGTEFMADEARRRAVEGVEKGVFYQGDRIDTVREYSDTLLIFLLKSRDRDRYSDKSETKHTVGGSLEQLILASMEPEEPGE